MLSLSQGEREQAGDLHRMRYRSGDRRIPRLVPKLPDIRL